MGLFKPNVERLKEKRDIKRLLKALYHKDYATRSHALVALGELRATESIGHMIKLLRDEKPVQRCNAAHFLGEFKAKEAVGDLIDCLKDSDADVVKNAVIALGKIGDREAIDPLLHTARTYFDHMLIYDGVVESLGNMKDDRLLSLVHAKLTVEGLGNLKYGNQNCGIWSRYSRAIEQLGSIKAVDVVLDIVDKRIDEVPLSPGHRLESDLGSLFYALIPLGKEGARRITEALDRGRIDLKRLGHGKTYLYTALAQMGGDEALEFFLKAIPIEDDQAAIRMTIEAAYKQSCNAGARVLIKALKEGGVPHRYAAMWLLQAEMHYEQGIKEALQCAIEKAEPGAIREGLEKLMQRL